jgi:hypothetical protein
VAGQHSPSAPSGNAANGDVLHKIFRRQAAEGDWNNALNALTAIQGARFQNELAEEAAARTLAHPAPAPENRVRFTSVLNPAGFRAPEPPENLALHL